VHVSSDEERDEERVQYWLEWLGLDHLQNMYPSQLSRGQRQRAAIARTLVLEPDLLLMDEPFSALDAPIREELQKVMKLFHQDSGLTSFTVTHDIEEAVFLGEKILVLSNSTNRTPLIVDNSLSGESELRSSPLFAGRCNELRELLATRNSNPD
jgi:ABC-type nitrate/sulfonate/bicarbonate transport system ATPase subunit